VGRRRRRERPKQWRTKRKDRAQKSFKNAQIFLVDYDGGPKYRTVALFDSEAEAKAEKDRAVKELRRSANEYFAFARLCPSTPILDAENGVSICEAQGAATYGYRSILRRKVSDALNAFTLAEALKPRGANYFEMVKTLSAYRPKLETAVGEDGDKIWSELASKILSDQSGYLPPETKAALQKMS
jgi:hypothetical protein